MKPSNTQNVTWESGKVVFNVEVAGISLVTSGRRMGGSK